MPHPRGGVETCPPSRPRRRQPLVTASSPFPRAQAESTVPNSSHTRPRPCIRTIDGYANRLSRRDRQSRRGAEDCRRTRESSAGQTSLSSLGSSSNVGTVCCSVQNRALAFDSLEQIMECCGEPRCRSSCRFDRCCWHHHLRLLRWE